MASLKQLKFDSIDEANLVLNGGIVGGPVLKNTTVIAGLVGLTITFSSPVGSCTFTQPTSQPGGLMSFLDVKTQLETAISGLKIVLLNNNSIGFRSGTAGTAVTMGSSSEPAKAILGFKDATSIAGTAYAKSGGTPPAVDHFTVEGGKLYYLVALP